MIRVHYRIFDLKDKNQKQKLTRINNVIENIVTDVENYAKENRFGFTIGRPLTLPTINTEKLQEIEHVKEKCGCFPCF